MATILIADDEYEIADFIRMGLEKKQHHVDIVTSGEEALKQLESRYYDLLILDLKMPGIGGEGVLAKRDSFPETKVIILTAYPSLQTAVSAVKNAADDYLFKPLKIPEIVRIVDVHLRRFEVGPYTIDMDTESVFFRENLIPMSPGLFDILVVFMRNPNRVMHHTDIAESLVRDSRTSKQYEDLRVLLAGGDETRPQVGHYLRAQISRLRSELDKYLPDNRQAILAQPRKGFWWNPALKQGEFN